MANVPEEYLTFDYGFSAVDDPASTQPPAEPVAVTATVPEAMERKLDSIEEKVHALTQLMFRMEEDRDERTTEAELRDKIRQLEAIIVPLLNNLLKTADKSYIHWPNRGPLIQKQLDRVLEITRG